jgi:surface antigen
MNAVRTLIFAGALIIPLQAAEAQLLFGSRLGEALYKGDDTKIIMQVGADMLRNAADGESRPWSNPQTGHGGTITIVRTYQRSGMRCRDAHVRSSLGERTIAYVLPVCQIADGTWKIASR